MREFKTTWRANWSKRTQRFMPVLAFLVVFGGLGSMLLFSSRAATPAASSEAESGTVSSAAAKVSDSSASNAQAVKFTGSGGGSTCIGFPDASCTGIPAGVTLTNATLDTSASNVSYTNKKFTNTTFPTITGSNLTFTNCSFPLGAIFRSGTNVTVTHSDFGADVAFSSSHTVRFSYNNIHEFEDGLDVTSDSGTMANDIVFNDNWVHHPTAMAPSHSDGSQIRGVAGLTVRHNTLDMGVWYTDNGTSVLNSALFFEDANGGNTGIIATNNYLNGGGYILYATGGSGSITNNTFGPDGHYGFVYDPVDAGFTRSGNVDTHGNPVTF